MPWFVSMRMIGSSIGALPITATRRSVIRRSDGFDAVLHVLPSAASASRSVARRERRGPRRGHPRGLEEGAPAEKGGDRRLHVGLQSGRGSGQVPGDRRVCRGLGDHRLMAASCQSLAGPRAIVLAAPALGRGRRRPRPRRSPPRSREKRRLVACHEVVTELLAGEERIPRDLLDKAECVAVVPSAKKFALGMGGRFGKGAVVCRRSGQRLGRAPHDHDRRREPRGSRSAARPPTTSSWS